jgi:triacylglycerol lipase
MLKLPPIYDGRFVFHPEQDAAYVHFENADAHPFQPNPAGFSRVNVWWLAEAALASYWAPADAALLFRAAGLESEYLNEKGTDCYVAWGPDFLVVAFRGTQPDEWDDMLTDARAAQVPWDDGTMAHQGFAEAIGDIWPRLSVLLGQLSVGRSVWFCGHSLGAALATLAAYRYRDTSGVCTLGCPRVGDPKFAAAFNARLAGKAFRYVNDQDVVTHVPPPVFLVWLYQHVDLRRFIAPDGTVSGGAPSIPHFFADLIGNPKVLLESVNGLLSGALTLTPTFLLDHMPKAYAMWLWNDYATHG